MNCLSCFKMEIGGVNSLMFFSLLLFELMNDFFSGVGCK